MQIQSQGSERGSIMSPLHVCPHLVPCPSCPGVLEKETHFFSLPMNKPSRPDPAEGVLQTLSPASHGATQDPTGLLFFLPTRATSQTSLFQHKASLSGQTFPVWVLQDTGAAITSLRNKQCCTMSAKLVSLIRPKQLPQDCSGALLGPVVFNVFTNATGRDPSAGLQLPGHPQVSSGSCRNLLIQERRAPGE